VKAEEFGQIDPDDGVKMDRAVRAAFADAVRRHRAANVPIAIWEDEQVKLLSPFDIPLSEEVEHQSAPHEGADDD
jgi:hypothetical protein